MGIWEENCDTFGELKSSTSHQTISSIIRKKHVHWLTGSEQFTIELLVDPGSQEDVLQGCEYTTEQQYFM